MSTRRVDELTDLGNIADGDKLVGERVEGTTVRITFNGVLYDADFISNGLMARTSSGVYANRTLTGTTDVITVTNGDGVSGNPTLTIAATYTGQTSIVTLGTIATGTWNGSLVSLTYGGTNANLTASNGGIVYSTATAMAILSGTATANKMLLSGATGAPTWSISTIPTSAGTVGKILRSDGTNYSSSTATFADTYAVSTILYASSANTVAGLATANSGVLVTSAGGVPSIATDIPTAVTLGGTYSYRVGGTDVSVADGGTGNSTATAYAVQCGGTTSTGAHQSIASVGTSGQVLTSAGAGALPTFVTSVGRLLSFQTFTSGTAATYTRPAGVSSILVECVGGGGGGGGITSNVANKGGSAGAGGGAYCRKFYSSAASTYTYTVGAGGAGGVAGTNNGVAGGNTTFDTLTAGGGQASTGYTIPSGTNITPGVFGGTATGGDINVAGGTSQNGFGQTSAAKGGSGGNSFYGAGAAENPATTGTSHGGNNGLNYGGGGSGASSETTSTNQAGGNGAGGIIIVWEFS